MNIIIAGDGEVGVHLAKSLTELDHNITVVDPHSELLKRLESETDLLTITGDSTSPQVLEDAGVDHCDLFLSVLHDESINLVTCILAKKLRAKRTVARITNAELLAPKHREMFRDLGVDEMVCPERIAAKEITNLLNNSAATEFFDFSGGLLTMYVVRLEEGSPVVGREVREATAEYPDLQARVVALLRGGDTIIPHGDTVFHAGDLAYIIGRANQLENINRVVGKQAVSIRNIMIAGGGRIGRYAAMTLSDRMRITLIEENRQRAEELSAQLDGPLIIHGDATDIELLKEEGLQHVDAFIGVTNSSETNVLTCLHAKRLGVGRTIALVENTGFIDISRHHHQQETHHGQLHSPLHRQGRRRQQQVAQRHQRRGHRADGGQTRPCHTPHAGRAADTRRRHRGRRHPWPRDHPAQPRPETAAGRQGGRLHPPQSHGRHGQALRLDAPLQL